MRGEKMIKIGITGKAKSGKDFSAAILAAELRLRGYKVVEASFADTLKQEAATGTGIKLSAFYDKLTKEILRPLMQAWGDIRKDQAVGGSLYYWADKLSKNVPPDVDFLIIRDVRYDFEARWCKLGNERNINLEVISPDQEFTPHTNHGSEAGIDAELVDYFIVNKQTIENSENVLRSNIQAVLNKEGF